MSEDKCGCLHPIPIGTTTSSIPDGLVSVGCSDLADCNDVNVSVWRYEINEGQALVGNFITNNCSALKICIEFGGTEVQCGKTVLSLNAVIRGNGWCSEVEEEATYYISDRIFCWDIEIPGVDATGCYSVAFNIRPTQARTLYVLSAGYCCTQCGSCA